MKIRATVTQVLGVQSGTSKAGNAWSKATIIVETCEQYPKKVALNNMRNPNEFAALTPGIVASFDFEIESREFNGRWYTEANCWAWTIESYPQTQGYGTR